MAIDLVFDVEIPTYIKFFEDTITIKKEDFRLTYYDCSS